MSSPSDYASTEMSHPPEEVNGPGELAEELYEMLRKLAERALRRQGGNLEPTDLVHQAWIRLSERYEEMPRVEFLALCATIMRRLTVDEARKRSREPRDGNRITLSGVPGELDEETRSEPIDLLQLDDALTKLKAADERWARIVELRFFGGLSGDEVAQALGLSRRTVVRDWTLARAWLKRAMS